MNGYKTDWRDLLRHVANFCFIGSYLCLTSSLLVAGSLFTIVGECMLAPSAFKHKSWSTILVAGVFLTLAISTLCKKLL